MDCTRSAAMNAGDAVAAFGWKVCVWNHQHLLVTMLIKLLESCMCQFDQPRPNIAMQLAVLTACRTLMAFIVGRLISTGKVVVALHTFLHVMIS